MNHLERKGCRVCYQGGKKENDTDQGRESGGRRGITNCRACQRRSDGGSPTVRKPQAKRAPPLSEKARTKTWGKEKEKEKKLGRFQTKMQPDSGEKERSTIKPSRPYYHVAEGEN